MNNKIFLIIFLFTIINHTIAKSETDYFFLGEKNFNLNKLEKSKFYFEKDIVRNPKKQISYLFLAKIYEIKKQNDEFEKNLNTVLLLDPKNEEALYLLIKKKINDGNYNLAKKKLDLFTTSCVKMCSKNKELKNLIKI